jgi:hypothetical protein
MYRSHQIPGIAQKIRQLKTAVFYDDSSALLKFPNGIIAVDVVDECGNIWFRANQFYQDTSDFPGRFPARLSFYRKNAGFQVNVDGTACIVRMGPKEMLPGTEALIRLEVTHAQVSRLKKEETAIKKRHTLGKWARRWLMQARHILSGRPADIKWDLSRQ